ncbi:hypothetical protein SPB21_03800 [Leptothoe sp. ISB3NOV94-8A]
MSQSYLALDDCSIVLKGAKVTTGRTYTRRGIPRIEITISEDDRTIVLTQDQFRANFIAATDTPAAQ